MRANIAINDLGIVLASSNAAPSTGGAVAVRVNQRVAITLGSDPTVAALLSLIRTLRAVKAPITLIDANDIDSSSYTQSKLCILLARMALAKLESENQKCFQSKIALVTPDFQTLDNLPDDLLRLAQMSFDAPDVPTSLIKVYDAKIRNLTLVGQSLSMKLCFVVVPKDLAWPDPAPLLAQSFDHCLDAPFNQWLAIIYETAMAIRSPLYQHGTICLNDNLTYQFKRIIYPIMPANERASNHRILLAARLLDDLEAPII
jgi:hypothetical protein